MSDGQIMLRTTGLLGQKFVADDEAFFEKNPSFVWRMRPLAENEYDGWKLTGAQQSKWVEEYSAAGRESDVLVLVFLLDAGRMRLPVLKVDNGIRLSMSGEAMSVDEMIHWFGLQTQSAPMLKAEVSDLCAGCGYLSRHGDVQFAPVGAPFGVLVCRACYEKRPFDCSGVTLFIEYCYATSDAAIPLPAQRRFEQGRAYIENLVRKSRVS